MMRVHVNLMRFAKKPAGRPQWVSFVAGSSGAGKAAFTSFRLVQDERNHLLPNLTDAEINTAESRMEEPSSVNPEESFMVSGCHSLELFRRSELP